MTEPKFKLTSTIPKALGSCADKLYNITQERKRLNREAKKIEEIEKALKKHLIDNLPKSHAEGVSGKFGKVHLVTDDIPSVTDWGKFYKHILKTKDFSLMQKRLAAPAIKEHWDEGEVIQGVGTYTVVKISLTKK